MPPSTKKRRVEDDSLSSLRSNAHELLDELVSSREDNTSASAATTFLGLKALQRKLLQRLSATQEKLTKQRVQRDQEELQIQNLELSLQWNQQSIQDCTNLATDEVEKLCRDEEQESPSLVTFLGADPQDPHAYKKIATKLNWHIANRKALDSEKRQLVQRAERMEVQLHAKQNQLEDLPERLDALQEATKPLQRLFGLSKLSTKRLERLEMAQRLSSPALFTLFQQLQSCLDMATTTTTHSSSGGDEEDVFQYQMSLEIENGKVLLHCVIPTVSKNHVEEPNQEAPTTATITFAYHSKWDLVSARDEYEGAWIGELFPHDVDDRGCYQWCNYVAGLHLPRRERPATTTLAVLRQLHRRLRAHSTLQHLLEQVLPRQENVSEWKVVQQDGSSDYLATMRLFGKQWVECQITTRRYPSRPPLWVLQQQHQQKHQQQGRSSVHLYQDSLAQLERRINVDLLSEVQEDGDGACEWILQRQLEALIDGLRSDGGRFAA